MQGSRGVRAAAPGDRAPRADPPQAAAPPDQVPQAAAPGDRAPRADAPQAAAPPDQVPQAAAPRRRGPRASAPGNRALRADALRNREQVLAAARDVFVELGPDAPLDEVARRAGVGIATLYRRFADRESLQRAVALDVLDQAGAAARAAEADSADAVTALGRYMHAALDLRISAVMPALLGRISFSDADLTAARSRAVEPVVRMLEVGQRAGQIRADIAFADVGTLLVRLSRPLPGPVPSDVDRALAHRHVDLFLDALRAKAPPPLGGPALSLSDLQHIAEG